MKAEVIATLKEMGTGLQWADLADVIQSAMCKAESVGVQNACRYALSDWFAEQATVPTPTEDVDLERMLRSERRRLPKADESGWKAVTAKLTEREKEVASRLSNGWSARDIAADLGLSVGTIAGATKRIRGRLADTALWFPILDALYGIPDTMRARGDYVTDLSEYRRQRVRHSVLARKERRTSVRGWKLAPADCVLLQPTKEQSKPDTRWYPGMPIRKWEPVTPSGLWAKCWEEFRIGKGSKRSVSKEDDCFPCDLKPRELAGLQSGLRHFFRRRDGWYLSSPLQRSGRLSWYPGCQSSLAKDGRKWEPTTPTYPGRRWYIGCRAMPSRIID